MRTPARRPRHVAAVVLAMVVAMAGVDPWSALAVENAAPQAAPTTTIAPSTSTSTTTTTTTATTTTATTTTTAPPPETSPAPPPAVTPAAPPAGGAQVPLDEPLPPGGSDDTEAPTEERGPFPEHLRSLTDSIRRTRANDTRALIEALAPLRQYGFSPEQTAVVGFGRFPVAGMATYSHDWWFPRFGPDWRLHEGTDIFAAAGTPVRAPADGRARIRDGGLGGLSVYVIEPDGTYYYLAHLAALAPDLVDGAAVRTGQVIGFTGDSGNAAGGLPHVHFEIHPRGGAPIDPKPVLDQFLADAVAGAPAIIEAYAEAVADQAPPRLPRPRAARLDDTGASRSALLWASAANPTGGALRWAQAEALRVAVTVGREGRSHFPAGWTAPARR